MPETEPESGAKAKIALAMLTRGTKNALRGEREAEVDMGPWRQDESADRDRGQSASTSVDASRPRL